MINEDTVRCERCGAFLEDYPHDSAKSPNGADWCLDCENYEDLQKHER